jgi:hypothetical protein
MKLVQNCVFLNDSSFLLHSKEEIETIHGMAFPEGHPVSVYVFFLVFPSPLLFSNVFYKAVPTRRVTNPVSLASFYCP